MAGPLYECEGLAMQLPGQNLRGHTALKLDKLRQFMEFCFGFRVAYLTKT